MTPKPPDRVETTTVVRDNETDPQRIAMLWLEIKRQPAPKAMDILAQALLDMQNELLGVKKVRNKLRRRCDKALAQVTALHTALEAYQKIAKSVSADLVSAHNARADQASEWMREEDRDLRRAFYTATDAAKAVLSAAPDITPRLRL